jgi:dGTPase
MISVMIADVIDTTLLNVKQYDVKTQEDVHQLGRPLVHFSTHMDEKQKVIKAFLMQNMYRHYKVCRMTSKARRIVSDLYDIFMHEPECLPTLWRDEVRKDTSEHHRSRIISDFIAGMTDRFAVKEHQRLFDLSYQNQ